MKLFFTVLCFSTVLFLAAQHNHGPQIEQPIIDDQFEECISNTVIISD